MIVLEKEMKKKKRMRRKKTVAVGVAGFFVVGWRACLKRFRRGLPSSALTLRVEA